MTVSFPPALLLLIGALLLPLCRGGLRTAVLLGLPLLALAAAWGVPDGTALRIAFLGLELEPVRGSGVARLFATVFTLMAFAGMLFALRQSRPIEQVAAFVYAGGALGVTFAGDLLTLFVFWELMAVGSTLVIWAADTTPAYRASIRYLMIHLLGGVVLMAGIAGHYAETGSIAFTAMQADSLARWLILAGFLVNVGAPPLSAWIPDAYPEASPSGAVFLSAFTTKTAVFTLLIGFPGTTLLVWVGLWMIFYGIIYALLENDMRRILAYSIVNQVGFMVCGIGIGTAMALNGAAAHAFAHIIYKALLLMSAGAVLYMTGRRKCSEVGHLLVPVHLRVRQQIDDHPGRDRRAPGTDLVPARRSVGRCVPACWHQVPMVRLLPERLRAAAARPTVEHACGDGAVCFPVHRPGRLPAAPLRAAALPGRVRAIHRRAPRLAVPAAALLPMMRRTETLSLDFDWFYRVLGKRLVLALFDWGGTALERLTRIVRQRAERLLEGLFRTHGPHGVLARTSPTGSMVLWVAVLLAWLLIASYA
jgi:multicomponent Na+:H+ antiporter subunit D